MAGERSQELSAKALDARTAGRAVRWDTDGVFAPYTGRARPRAFSVFVICFPGRTDDLLDLCLAPA
jgi:hypothetical protein